jgi:hypothetical protein
MDGVRWFEAFVGLTGGATIVSRRLRRLERDYLRLSYKRIDCENGHVRACCRNAASIVVLTLRVTKSITRSVMRTIEMVRRVLE